MSKATDTVLCQGCGRDPEDENKWNRHDPDCTLHPDMLEKQAAAARAALIAGSTHPGWSKVPKPRPVPRYPDTFRYVHPGWPAATKRWILSMLTASGRSRVIPLSFFHQLERDGAA